MKKDDLNALRRDVISRSMDVNRQVAELAKIHLEYTVGLLDKMHAEYAGLLEKITRQQKGGG